MYGMHSIDEMIPSVPPPDYAGSGRRSRGFDFEQTWNAGDNIATLDGFPGNRGASYFNVDYNREQNVMEAIRVSQTREQVLRPRWPAQTIPNLSKLEGHIAVLPSLLQVSAGQLGGLF